MDQVIYHAACADGFCAAWLAHKAYPNAEYVPCQYGQDPPDVTGKDVLMVDFSFKRPLLLAMKEKARSLIVLDHHKTAQDDLAELDFCTFDMAKSGARLAWEWLTKNAVGDFSYHAFDFDPAVPWLVAYTEDRDLWRWKLPRSKEVNAALRTRSYEFDVWDDLAKRDPLAAFAAEGEGIVRYQQKLVASHVEHAQEITLLGHKVLACECTCADLTSEIAGELAKDRPFGVCWFETADNFRVFSLRSRDGGIDVSEVAKVHGGGGHKQAAGFRMPCTGAMGTFSDGRMVGQEDDDEGDIRIAIAVDKDAQVIRLEFGKPVAWLGLPKRQTLTLADMLSSKARMLK